MTYIHLATRDSRLPSLLQIVNEAGPILLQQPRHRSVRQQPPAGLTAGTVVGLVVSIADSLDWRAAVRAGLLVAAVDGHSLAKGRDLLRKLLSLLASQPRNPILQRPSSGMIQTTHLFVGELPGARQRREPGPVQDFIRIRIADSAEETRVGQRTLEGMAFRAQPLGEAVFVRFQYLEPASLELDQALFSCYQIDGGAALGAYLGEHENSGGKLERRQSHLTRRLGTGGLPAKAPGNHQVDHQEESILELKDDPLSHPPEA